MCTSREEWRRTLIPVLAHEMAHAADPSIHEHYITHRERKRRMPSMETDEGFKAYVNSPIEVTAQLTEVERELRHTLEHNGFVAREARDGAAADVLRLGSNRFTRLSEHLTPENRKRFLRLAARLVEEHREAMHKVRARWKRVFAYRELRTRRKAARKGPNRP